LAPAEAELTWLQAPARLTDEEILTLVREVFLPLGIDGFRLTHGEPLLRLGSDVALTPTASTSVKKPNFSMGRGYAASMITDWDRWQQIWAKIQVAHQVGFNVSG
jgi:cyclic pyranopterin phosphate synthase